MAYTLALFDLLKLFKSGATNRNAVFTTFKIKIRLEIFSLTLGFLSYLDQLCLYYRNCVCLRWCSADPETDIAIKIFFLFMIKFADLNNS